MTKRDYELIANSFNSVVGILGGNFTSLDDYKSSYVVKSIVNDLCISLRADNPNFNDEIFKEACGIEE